MKILIFILTIRVFMIIYLPEEYKKLNDIKQ